MTYYHCSQVSGLKVLEPKKPTAFDKPANVYMTTSLPMALMYSIRNYEYSYGYTKEGQIFFDEYFPNALKILYRGKSASLYICDPASVKQTEIPNEVVSEDPVRIIDEILIPDAYEAILEEERKGTLKIYRYFEQTEKSREWIRCVQVDIIRKKNLIDGHDPDMAEYYRTHYPQSWDIVMLEEKDGETQ